MPGLREAAACLVLHTTQQHGAQAFCCGTALPWLTASSTEHCLITVCLRGPEVTEQVTQVGCSSTQPDLLPDTGCPSTRSRACGDAPRY